MTTQSVELGEIQQREHATHAWWHCWCCPTFGRIAVAAAGGEGGGGEVPCSKASCGTQNGWWSKSHIRIYAKAAEFFCHMYVGLHAPGWLQALGMPPRGYFPDFATLDP